DAYDAVLEETLSSNINPDDPNEFDNNNYKARPITVLLTPPPDLVVTAASTTPAATDAGTSLTVRWTVQNQGTGATEDSTWYDDVYLKDGGTTWFLGKIAHDGALTSGQSYTAEQTFALSPAVKAAQVEVRTNAGPSPTWE